MTFNKNFTMAVSVTTLVLSVTSVSVQAGEQPYIVIDGNHLDANSYNGFKLYRNWCARCHGTYGQGLVGPDLTKSLNVIGKDEFFDIVENGKTASIGNMPAGKSNVKVMQGRDALYSYLKARADGAIGEVRPKKVK